MNNLIEQLSVDDQTNLTTNKSKMSSNLLSDEDEKTFNSLNEAESYIECEDVWIQSYSQNVLDNGYIYIVQNYLCRTNNCPATICVRYIDDNKVLLRRSLISHTHELSNSVNNDADLDQSTHSNEKGIIKDDNAIFDELKELTMHDMIYEKKFSTLNMAFKYIEDVKTWCLISTERIENTTTIMKCYKCNLSSIAGEPCPVKKYLVSELTSSALLYRNEEQHNHDTHDQNIKNEPYLIEVSDDDDETVNMPPADTIEKWLLSISNVPKDYHTVYCVDYTLDRDIKKLRFFLSTQQLLKIARESRSIHITSTTTLLWNNYNVILVGTTDLDKKFHSFGIAICGAKMASDYEFIFNAIQKGITECFHAINFRIDTLLSDYNPDVQKAFKYVYGNTAKTITCLKSFNSSISKMFTNKYSILIIHDILKLQRLPSADEFNFGVELFLKKWPIEYIEKFKNVWLDENCNWYEGFSYYTPTDNRIICNEYEILRKYFETPETFDLLKDQLLLTLKTFSTSYVNCNKYAKKPEISNDMFYDTCRWLRQPKHLEINKTGSETLYYINSDSRCGRVDNMAMKILRDRESDSFDQYFALRAKYYTVRKNQKNDIICDCATFFQHFLCHHSIGVAYLLNIYTIPISKIPDPWAIPYYLKLT